MSLNRAPISAKATQTYEDENLTWNERVLIGTRPVSLTFGVG